LGVVQRAMIGYRSGFGVIAKEKSRWALVEVFGDDGRARHDTRRRDDTATSPRNDDAANDNLSEYSNKRWSKEMSEKVVHE